MTDDPRKIVELIALPDEAYYRFGDAEALPLQAKLAGLLGAGALAPLTAEPSTPAATAHIAVSAPKTVKLGERDDLPILLAAHETGLHRWQVNEQMNMRVVVQDLESGRVMTARLQVIPGKRMKTPDPSGSGPKPDAINAGTTLSSVRRYFLRNLLGIDWRASRLAVTVVFYDHISNTAVVDLQGEPAAEAAPVQPTAFIANAAPAGEDGVALSVPAAGGPIGVAIKLPAALAAVAPSTQAGHKVLLASLLMVKLDDDEPVQIDLAAPAVVQGPPDAPTVAAAFQFDPRAALADPALEGAYQTYLFAGAKTAGPYLFTAGH